MDCFVLFCVSLFFNGDGYHRDRHVLTHSFPTRRSSDLCRSCTAPPTPAARSAPWAPCSAPARVEPVRSPLFSKDVLDDLVLEHLLGQELLQPPVLGLQLLQALRIGHAHAPELAAPQVVRGFAEAVLATQLLDRQPGLGLTQEADDLLFGKALLHVQSPCSGELDSRSRRYSKPGGDRKSTRLNSSH